MKCKHCGAEFMIGAPVELEGDEQKNKDFQEEFGNMCFFCFRAMNSEPGDPFDWPWVGNV